MFKHIVAVVASLIVGCGAAVEEPRRDDGISASPDIAPPTDLAPPTYRKCEPLVVSVDWPHVSCLFDVEPGDVYGVDVVFRDDPQSVHVSFCNEKHECWPIVVDVGTDATAPNVAAKWIAPRHLHVQVRTDARHWYAVAWL